MNLPNRLYKYQPSSIQALTNLSAAKLWFSNPSRFNDPFDCALEASLTEISEEDCLAMLKNIVPSEDVRDKFLKEMGPKELQQQIMAGARNSLAKGLGKTRGVCCFTEVFDDLLMWGHYADSHRGFCLEFNRSLEPFSFAESVRYAESFPILDMRRFVDEDFSQILELLRTKATYWKYEREWRSIHQNSDQPFGYERKALTGVYFGAKMPEDQQLMIAVLLNQTGTKLFRMRLSKSQFKLEPEPITFTRVDYRGDDGTASSS